MNGDQLDAAFGTGFSNLKALKVTLQSLSVPSQPVTNHSADVQEQQHDVDATLDAATGTLSIAKNATGDGLWIPWLGQGSNASNNKGWGTYTKAVTNKSWVATGPFSGCYAVAFAQGPRFAHIVTPGGGYTAASVDGQIAEIKSATGLSNATKIDMTGAAEGYAFFLKINGNWYYRRVFTLPGSGMLMQSSARPTKLI